ncbi:MAG: acetate--CoA ligase family protein [Paracoccaceae bacterium]
MSGLGDLLSPEVVAVVGASDDPVRIGGRPIKYMKEFGFSGRIVPVNPKRETVQGLRAFPSVADIEGRIDFALLATPAPTVPGAIRDAAAKGAKAVMVFSSGFREAGEEGAALEDAALAAARETGVRLIGPNCLGGFNAGTGFTPCFSATLERGRPETGGLGIASQSGAYGSHIYFLARKRGIGTRYLLTTGNEADVTVAETIGLMAEDEDVHCILAYCEGVKDGERLVASLETARAARKPVVMMKVGRSEVGAAAAASHTASLAGEDAVYDAVLRQFGAWRARTTEEALDIAYAARPRLYPVGRRVGIVTISGGAGVLMADAAEAEGLDVAPMPEDAQAALKARVPFAAPRNPVDVTAQSFNDMGIITDFIRTMMERGAYDSIVAFWTTVAGSASNAAPLRAAMAEGLKGHEDALVIQSLVADPEIVASYEADGFPVFEDPSRAVAALGALTRFGEGFAKGADAAPAVPAARGLPDGALGEREARAVLAAAGLPMAEDVLAKDAGEAAAAAARFGTVAIKVASADILHKTEAGGVALGVPAERAGDVFSAMMRTVAERAPGAAVEGALVSPMLPEGVDLILGAKRDPVFGPVVMVGLGGIFTEVLRDVAFRKAPVSPAVAEEMLRELKGFALLDGARGAPPCDVGAAAAAVSALSVFAAAEDAVESVEVNPMRVFPGGAPAACLGLDALIERG